MNRRLVSLLTVIAAALVFWLPRLDASPQRGATTRTAAAPAQAPAATLSAATRQQLMASLDRAAAYLRQQQKPDGRWETQLGPIGNGVTGMVATALLHQPGADRAKQMQTVGRALDALVKLAKPDGGIYDKDIPHYITAVSVSALVAGGRPGDRPVIERARKYLADHLLDEGEGVSKSDPFYGGLGYGGTSDGGKADVVSLEFGLRAMKDADLPANDPAWQKALIFLQRTQNASETNDQKWASNDGGFIYYPGYSQAGGTQSYGAGTYAGLMSYMWADVKKTDSRVQDVLKWVRNNYTVDENPGCGQHALYYYYMVFGKALQAVGEPTIVDAKGQRHNWREDLGKKLLSLQHPEGYWVNTDPDEMQDNKVLVTAFSMMAIEAALK